MVDIVLGNASDYLLLIILFAVILDLDHIPHLIRINKDIFKKKFGFKSRTRIHEMYGFTIVSILFSFSALMFDIIMLRVIALILVLHYAIDFMIGDTRPLYPFSEKSIFLGLLRRRHRMKFEIISTILLGVTVWLIS